MVYKRLERFLIQLEAVDSTNDYAADLIKSSFVKNGATIIADHQLKGRGQRSALWTAEAGKNLTSSTIIFPDIEAGKAFYLNIIAALAVRKTLSDLGVEAKIKWPNDILVDSKKICGILVENVISGSKINSAVIGIGLNINQLQFHEGINATSLALLKKQDFEILDIFDQFFGYLDFYLNLLCDSHFDLLKKHYYEHFYLINEVASFESEGEQFNAEVLGITEQGLLLLNRQEGKKAYDIKEVTFL